MKPSHGFSHVCVSAGMVSGPGGPPTLLLLLGVFGMFWLLESLVEDKSEQDAHTLCPYGHPEELSTHFVASVSACYESRPVRASSPGVRTKEQWGATPPH